jgi:hypothetical protein
MIGRERRCRLELKKADVKGHDNMMKLKACACITLSRAQ